MPSVRASRLAVSLGLLLAACGVEEAGRPYGCLQHCDYVREKLVSECRYHLRDVSYTSAQVDECVRSRGHSQEECMAECRKQ